jgi:hypothetical protein
MPHMYIALCTRQTDLIQARNFQGILITVLGNIDVLCNLGLHEQASEFLRRKWCITSKISYHVKVLSCSGQVA